MYPDPHQPRRATAVIDPTSVFAGEPEPTRPHGLRSATVAVVLVVAGVYALLRNEILWAAGLIILALLVGRGGVSFFS